MPQIPKRTNISILPSDKSPATQVDAMSYSAQGRDLSILGGRLKQAAQKMQEAKNLYDVTTHYNQYLSQMDDIEKQALSDPDVFNNEEKYYQEIDKISNNTISSVQDPNAQLELMAKVKGYSNLKKASISTYFRKRKLDNLKLSLYNTMDNIQQQYVSAILPHERIALKTQAKAMIDEYVKKGVITADNAKKYWENVSKSMEENRIYADIETDPDMAKQALESGEYDISPKEKSKYLDYISKYKHREAVNAEKQLKMIHQKTMNERYAQLLSGQLSIKDIQEDLRQNRINAYDAKWLIARIGREESIPGTKKYEKAATNLESYFNIKKNLLNLSPDEAQTTLVKAVQEKQISDKDARSLYSYYEKVSASKSKVLKNEQVKRLSSWVKTNSKLWSDDRKIADLDDLMTSQFLAAAQDVQDPAQYKKIADKIIEDKVRDIFPEIKDEFIPNYIFGKDDFIHILAEPKEIPVNYVLRDGKIEPNMDPRYKGISVYIPSIDMQVGVDDFSDEYAVHRKLEKFEKQQLKQLKIDKYYAKGGIDFLAGAVEFEKALGAGAVDIAAGAAGIVSWGGDIAKDFFNKFAQWENNVYKQEKALGVPLGIEGVAAPVKIAALRGLSKIGEWVSVIGDKASKRLIKIANESKALKPVDTTPFLEHPTLGKAIIMGARGIPSLAAGVGMSLITKNPGTGIMFLSALSGEQTYSEAKEAGKSVTFSTALGGLQTVASYITNKLEFDFLLRKTNVPASAGFLGVLLGVAKKGAVGALTEMPQEGSEQYIQNLIAKYGYDKTRDLMQGVVESMVGAAFAGGIVGLGVSPILFDIKNNTDISDGNIGKVAEKVAENLIKDSDVVDTLIENSENIRKAGGLEEAIKEVEQKQKEGQPINSVEQKLVKLKEEPKQKQEEMKKKETPTQEAKALIRENQQPTQEQAKKEPWEMTREEYVEQNALIPAIKDLNSGEVFVGKRGQIHAQIAEKIPNLEDRKIESGWVDNKGQYVTFREARKINKAEDALSTWNKLKKEHEASVVIAFAKGKPVPPEVLKDYPDLVKEYGRGVTKKTIKKRLEEKKHLLPDNNIDKIINEVKNSIDFDDLVKDIDILKEGKFIYTGEALGLGKQGDISLPYKQRQALKDLSFIIEENPKFKKIIPNSVKQLLQGKNIDENVFDKIKNDKLYQKLKYHLMEKKANPKADKLAKKSFVIKEAEPMGGNQEKGKKEPKIKEKQSTLTAKQKLSLAKKILPSKRESSLPIFRTALVKDGKLYTTDLDVAFETDIDKPNGVYSYISNTELAKTNFKEYDFPRIEGMKVNKPTAEAEIRISQNAAKRIKESLAKDDTERYGLTLAHLYTKGDTLYAAASNARILTIEEIGKITKGKLDEPISVPLSKILNTAINGKLKIGDDSIQIETPDYNVYISKVKDVSPPNFEQFKLSKETKNTYQYNKKQILDAISKAKKLKAKEIKFDYKNGEIIIVPGNPNLGEVKMKLKGSKAPNIKPGYKNTIVMQKANGSFDVDLLKRSIQNIKSDYIRIADNPSINAASVVSGEEIAKPNLVKGHKQSQKKTEKEMNDEVDINDKQELGRPLPKDMKPVGNEFWVEIMDAAKKLVPEYRYKALRKNIKGSFHQEKGIKLQDVRSVTTATHELGHSIDYKMNGNRFPSKIKDRLPNAQGTERELRAELKAVSRRMRPDLWGANNGKGTKYANKHSELMADFISHYILDPEASRKLAPNVTEAFEEKLPKDIKEIIDGLHKNRGAGKETSPISEIVKKKIKIDNKDLRLAIREGEDYVKQADKLAVDKVRNQTVQLRRAYEEAKRIDELVPDAKRQMDLMVLADGSKENPWTGQSAQEIEKSLNENEKKALKLFRGYQELFRQTVNKYLRPHNKAEYIDFLNNYFIHFYNTELTDKYKTAIGKWFKSSPSAKQRVIPTIAEAVKMGLDPKAKTLSDGLRLWAGINYKVAGNVAFLNLLPKITNEAGESVIQNPKNKPEWPTRDYWALRKIYARPIKGKGVVLYQGKVAVDPKIIGMIDAMFESKNYSNWIRNMEAINSFAKAMNLTLGSFFHHQTEALSATGSFGHKTWTGLPGEEAKALGKTRINILELGKQLEKIPEFVDDAQKHGLQLGRITTEGINELENVLKGIEEKLKAKGNSLSEAMGLGVGKTKEAYRAWQNLLWDNVTRAKLSAYYTLTSDMISRFPDVGIDTIKEAVAKYVNNNYGGQEWMNMRFMRNPKIRQIMSLGFLSPDWTISQLRTFKDLFNFNKTDEAKVLHALSNKHWANYMTSLILYTVLANLALSGKFPWENERGHKFDIDYTKTWRAIDEALSKISGKPNWRQRGDFTHRYFSIGKSLREVIGLILNPVKSIGSKASPIARQIGGQLFGNEMGSEFPLPWTKDTLEKWEKGVERVKYLGKMFAPFSLSGNSAFLAFPAKKGMTQYKATKALEAVYRAQAKQALSGVTGAITKLTHILAQKPQAAIKQIEEAAKFNKVDFKKAKQVALSKIRTDFYNAYFSAYINKDKKRIERIRKALKAIGTTDELINKALERRLQYHGLK